MSHTILSAGSNSGYASRGRWHATGPKKLDKYPILGQVTHVDGTLWDVRDVRTTKHGFDLHYGSPADPHGLYHGGMPQLIDTQALYDFWDVHRTKGFGFLFDLPAGRTTLKRARRRMGFNFNNDVDNFWLDRIGDLRDMKLRDFAVKHDVEVEVACDWRRKLLGLQVRPLGWWRTAATYEILLSKITLREMGEKLGIKISHCNRLRQRARVEPLPLPVGPEPMRAAD